MKGQWCFLIHCPFLLHRYPMLIGIPFPCICSRVTLPNHFRLRCPISSQNDNHLIPYRHYNAFLTIGLNKHQRNHPSVFLLWMVEPLPVLISASKESGTGPNISSNGTGVKGYPELTGKCIKTCSKQNTQPFPLS